VGAQELLICSRGRGVRVTQTFRVLPHQPPAVRVQARQPDPVYAHKLQELIGGACGEMTVTMQYLFQGWNCRMPGKYKDLIMDIATEEIGRVEIPRVPQLFARASGYRPR
jgi:manganese containing catalase